MPFLFLLCALLLTDCSSKRSHQVQNIDPSPDLMAKLELYEGMTSKKYEWDFIYDGCDSLLFTGLYYSTGTDTKIELAKDDSGKWHRRSLDKGPCYPGESKSEISRDMYLGLMWGIWKNKRSDILQGVIEYGEKNNWKMGEGDPSRTIMTPQLVSTLYQMAGKLYGASEGESNIPIVNDDSLKGFQAHLQVLHIAIRGEIHGYIDEGDLDNVVALSKRQPQNAFFDAVVHRYTDGDQTRATAMLLDWMHWPQDRLPSTKNHCEFWLWQRDDGDDWRPCKPVKEHSGADFIFAAKYVLGK